MAVPKKFLLVALALSALLLLAAVPAAEAGGARSLKQWSDWSDWSWGRWGPWGPTYPWYGQPDPSGPVGSGCYDAYTGYRYRHGETQYCAGGGRRRCNWGTWEESGNCQGAWTR